MEGVEMASIGDSSAGVLAGSGPRFGGVLARLVGPSNGLMVRFAGRAWNPIFSVVEHVGRRSGRRYETPVAARRVDGGFVISLAFGRQVDWHRNMVAAGGAKIRWRDREYEVSDPVIIDREAGMAAFNAIQRFFLRLGGIDSYIAVRDVSRAAT